MASPLHYSISPSAPPGGIPGDERLALKVLANTLSISLHLPLRHIVVKVLNQEASPLYLKTLINLMFLKKRKKDFL